MIYYVATTGSDANNGLSPGAAWRTLQHAAGLVLPGDTVNVAAGTYVGANLTVSGAPNFPILWLASGAVTITSTTFGGIRFGFNASGPWYNVIDGFTVAAQSGDPDWDYGIRFGGIPPGGSVPQWAFGNIVRNCTVQLRVVSHGDQSGNGDKDGIFSSWQDGLQVLNNTVSGGWDSGIYTSNSARNYTVQGNTVFSVGGNGIHNNGDAGAGGPGVNTNALIARNIVHDTGYGIGGQAISCDGLQNSRVQNNLCYNCYAKGISLYVVNAGGPSTGNVVVNNTVLCVGGGPDPGVCMRVDGQSVNNKIYNNIWIRTGSTFNWVYELDPDPSVLTVDYNSVVLASNGTVQLGESWANWQSGLGWDVRGYRATAAEQFTNAGANDYTLKAGALAFSRGTGTLAPTNDLLGNPRPQFGGYDTGAYQINKTTVLPAGKTLLDPSWFGLVGYQRLPTTMGDNAYGGLACRYAQDGSLHFFVVDRLARGVVEVVSVGFVLDTTFVTCPRATLFNNWGAAIFESKGLWGPDGDPAHAETQGLLWNPAANALYCTQGLNYDVGPGALPFLMEIVFNPDGSTTANGPWLLDVGQQLGRNYLCYVPSWFSSFIGGRSLFAGAGLESGDLSQSHGPGYLGLDTPDAVPPTTFNGTAWVGGTLTSVYASQFYTLNADGADPDQFDRRYRRTADYTPVQASDGQPATYPGTLQNPVPSGTGGYWQNIDVIRAATFLDAPNFTGVLYCARLGAWDKTSGVPGVNEGATWYGDPLLPNGIVAACFNAKGGNAANYVPRWYIQDPSVLEAVLQGTLATWQANPTYVFDPVAQMPQLVLPCDKRVTGMCADPNDPTVLYLAIPQVDHTLGAGSKNMVIAKIQITAPSSQTGGGGGFAARNAVGPWRQISQWGQWGWSGQQ